MPPTPTARAARPYRARPADRRNARRERRPGEGPGLREGRCDIGNTSTTARRGRRSFTVSMSDVRDGAGLTDSGPAPARCHDPRDRPATTVGRNTASSGHAIPRDRALHGDGERDHRLDLLGRRHCGRCLGTGRSRKANARSGSSASSSSMTAAGTVSRPRRRHRVRGAGVSECPDGTPPTALPL